jgi:hypothetical protein
MFTSRCVCASNCAYTCASVLKLGTGIYTRRFGRQVHDYSRDNGGSTSVLAPGLTLWMTYLLICKKEACPSQTEVCTSWRCETTKSSTGNLRLRTTCPCCSSFFGSVMIYINCRDLTPRRALYSPRLVLALYVVVYCGVQHDGVGRELSESRVTDGGYNPRTVFGTATFLSCVGRANRRAPWRQCVINRYGVVVALTDQLLPPKLPATLGAAAHQPVTLACLYASFTHASGTVWTIPYGDDYEAQARREAASET